MKNKSKLWMISLICIGVGIVVLTVGLILGGRPGFYINQSGIHSSHDDYSGTPHIQEKTALDEFSSIDMDIDYADVEIRPSDGYYIAYQLYGRSPKPELEVKDQELHFKESTATGLSGLNFNFFALVGYDVVSYDYYVTLYVPADRYFSLVRIKNGDGRIDIGNISAETMEITDEYGSVEVGSFAGKQLKVTLDSGALKIDKLLADDVNLHNKYGECRLGSVKGEKLEVKLDDGTFSVDKNEIKNLTVENEYGTVKIGLSDKTETYDLDLKTDYGTIEIPGYPDLSHGDDETSFKSNHHAEDKVYVRSSDGNIIITETE